MQLRVLALAAALMAALPVALAASGSVAVHVSGTHLIDAAGNPLRLLGVDRSDTEYECLSGGAIFDGPVDPTAIAAITSWNANAVRVPLNEDCWLGINLGTGNPDAGASYRQAIRGFVADLNAAGLYVILDLHWNAPGTNVAGGQQPMADLDHAPAFWQSVARAFKENPAVLFDLYNEPYVDSWKCWRDGCQVTTSLGAWQTAGMARLVKTVRLTGATQPLLLGGLSYAGDLSRWLEFVPPDPLAQSSGDPVPGEPQIVASVHTYCFGNTVADCQGQLSSVEAAWPAMQQVAAAAPVVAGEFGETDCATTYVEPFMNFADTNGLSYLGWAWDTYDCNSFPSLISAYDATPTAYGIGLKNRLEALAQ
jgi:endoglucanase